MCQRVCQSLCACFRVCFWNEMTFNPHGDELQQWRHNHTKSKALWPRWDVVCVEEKKKQRIKAKMVSHPQQQATQSFPYRCTNVEPTSPTELETEMWLLSVMRKHNNAVDHSSRTDASGLNMCDTNEKESCKTALNSVQRQKPLMWITPGALMVQSWVGQGWSAYAA